MGSLLVLVVCGSGLFAVDFSDFTVGMSANDFSVDTKSLLSKDKITSGYFDDDGHVKDLQKAISYVMGCLVSKKRGWAGGVTGEARTAFKKESLDKVLKAFAALGGKSGVLVDIGPRDNDMWKILFDEFVELLTQFDKEITGKKGCFEKDDLNGFITFEFVLYNMRQKLASAKLIEKLARESAEKKARVAEEKKGIATQQIQDWLRARQSQQVVLERKEALEVKRLQEEADQRRRVAEEHERERKLADSHAQKELLIKSLDGLKGKLTDVKTRVGSLKEKLGLLKTKVQK